MAPEQRIKLGGLSEATPELRQVERVDWAWASRVQHVRDGNIYLPSPRKDRVKN
jgi:hypothetical protein